jgi:hypothetical protein
MRITALLVAFVTGLTLAMTGCGGTSELDQAPASEAVVADEQLSQADSSEGNVSAMAGGCPRIWECSTTGTIYTTLTKCNAACGGAPCYGDYACDGTCICP